MVRLRLSILALFFLAACTPVVNTVEGIVDDRSAGQVLDDNVIHTKIAANLANESGRLFLDVDTVVFQGRVMLTGAVKERDNSDAATRIANSVKGVREVINEVQVTQEGGFSTTASDLTIETKLKVKLVGADAVRESNYRWKSVNGVVYLLGIAQDQAERDRVLALVKDTEGVRRLVDHTRLRGQQPA